MHIVEYNGDTEIVFIGLEHGEKLYTGIIEACKEANIKHGVILSGIAVVSDADLHFVDHTEYPQDITYYNIEKPFEMTSITGIIVDFIPHIHVSLIAGKDQVHGGHLHEATIGYLGELAILKCANAPLKRTQNKKGIDVMHHISTKISTN